MSADSNGRLAAAARVLDEELQPVATMNIVDWPRLQRTNVAAPSRVPSRSPLSTGSAASTRGRRHLCGAVWRRGRRVASVSLRFLKLCDAALERLRGVDVEQRERPSFEATPEPRGSSVMPSGHVPVSPRLHGDAGSPSGTVCWCRFSSDDSVRNRDHHARDFLV